VTLDFERFKAINNIRTYLERVMLGEEVMSRKTARMLLKHYPEAWFVEKMEKRCLNECGVVEENE